MTEYQAQKLAKTLARMLSYDAKVYYEPCRIPVMDLIGVRKNTVDIIVPGHYRYSAVPIDEVKICLRPMSSMTDEEKAEYDQLRYDPWHSHYDEQISFKMIDWLSSHHFDFEGLINEGIAIEETSEQ